MALVQRLEGSARLRSAQYGECKLRLDSLTRLSAGQPDGRALNALLREVAWHVRCLAGFGEAEVNPASQHRAWALEGLEDLGKRFGG